MNDVVRRWLRGFGATAFVSLALTSGTGCGALKAAANPKVAWALNDPAPMSVVVRRADMAEKTADNIDRVMTNTPLADDSAWLGKVAPDEKASNDQLVALRKHELYTQNVKIVACEVWAQNLSQLEAKTKAGETKAPLAAKDTAVAAADAAPADTATDKPAKKKGNGKKKDKTASAGKSDKADKKAAKAPKEPATQAAAPTPAPAPTAPKYTSILAAIDGGLGEEWGKIMEKRKAIGEAKAQIAVLEAANDQKGVSDADKKANKKKIDELEKANDKIQDEADKLSKEFVPKAKTAAQKTDPAMREKLGPVLVNLRQAVDDANISNGAAAVRYPLAVTSMKDSAMTMVKVYVADVIEEKTGKRPSTMSSLQPGVTLEGGSIQVTINGITASDLSGKLTVGELTSEVASRTVKWFTHAVGLMGTISSTKDTLTFEDDVLEALLDGFKAGGYTAPAAGKIPEAPPPGAAAPSS